MLAEPIPCSGNRERSATTRSFMTRPPAFPSARTTRSTRSPPGIDPQTTAHGVKIDQISITEVAMAAKSGQIEFAG